MPPVPNLFLYASSLALLFSQATAVPPSSEFLPSHDQYKHWRTAQSIQQKSSWPATKAVLVSTFKSWFKLRTRTADGVPSAPQASASKLLAQYSDQLVLRFTITSEEEHRSLAEACNILFLDVWEQSDTWVDIRLAHDMVPSLLGLLVPSLQHAHKPLMSSRDLARSIADTYPNFTNPASSVQSRKLSYGFIKTSKKHEQTENFSTFFEHYRSLQDINRWMDDVISSYSSYVTKITVGSSFEGRNISAFRVSVASPAAEGAPPKRPTIIISAGQHAREWVSTSTVNYIAHSFISSYGKDPLVSTLLETLDFVLIPTLNPDGYAYTWSYDRLWRKNRQTTYLQFCKGIDLERSWEYKWDGGRTIDNPCSESFAGETALQAVESSTFSEWVKNQIESQNIELVGLIDLHSYSQQILYPYAFSCSTAPPTLENLQELGQGLAKSIRIASREKYQVLSACEGNVAASGKVLPRLEGGGGSLLDWFYQTLGVRVAYQIKLRDKGSYGFLLPPEEIIPTGSEIFQLVKHFARLIAMPEAITKADGTHSPSQHVLA